jgi:multisubunit Na+/H+ antiporter MnhE subunit
VYFAYKLVESSVVVARTVIRPRHRIRTGIVAVPLHGCSDAVGLAGAAVGEVGATVLAEGLAAGGP